MNKQFVTIRSSDTTQGLESMINDFLSDGGIRIINISYSTCWDHELNYVLHSAALAYEIDSESLNRTPTDFSDDERETYT